MSELTEILKELKGMQDGINEMREDFSKRFDNLDKRLDSLETRFDSLESTTEFGFGTVSSHLDRQDQRMTDGFNASLMRDNRTDEKLDNIALDMRSHRNHLETEIKRDRRALTILGKKRSSGQ